MKGFESFPGDDPAALDAAARALLALPLEFAAAQLASEPACVHDHWGGTHATVAFVRPSRGARFVRCDYASDHGVYLLPEHISDACRRAAVKAFIDRFAYAPMRHPKPAYAPMVEARMAPSRPGQPPYVLSRATVGVGDDAAAVCVFTAPEPVFGRHARAVFGPLVVAVADIDDTRECVFAGCAHDADDYAFAELAARMRRLAVARAGGDDVVLRIELRERGARAAGAYAPPLACATAEFVAHAAGTPPRRVLVAAAGILPIDTARERFDALLCGRTRAADLPSSVAFEGSLVAAIEPPRAVRVTEPSE